MSGGQEKPFISGTTVDYGDEIDMQLHWNVPNSVTVKSGDTFVYDLPENLTFQSGQQYDIINGSGDVVGHYVINGNRMVATYTRGEDAGSNVTAYVTVKGAINSDKTGGNNGGDKTFSYPGYGDVTLYAEWTRTSHQWTIKFDLNGGAAPEGKEATKLYADQRVYDGDPLISSTVDQTNVPVLDGYEFQGWSTVRNDAFATSVLSFDEDGKSLMPIDRDGTVYALWAKMGTVVKPPTSTSDSTTQSQIGAYSNGEMRTMSLMPSLSLIPTVASNPSLVVLMPIIGIFAVPRRLTSSGLMPNEETNTASALLRTGSSSKNASRASDPSMG